MEDRDEARFGLTDVEIRESGNGKDWTLTGLAAVYEKLSEPLVSPFGRFREKLARGAFTEVLATSPDVRLLFNHDESYVMARTRSGTLELTETEQGLRVWARVAPTQWGRDLRESLLRGDVDQMSFAFTVEEDEWEDKDDGAIIRTIKRVGQLFDVSVVTFAAYPQTSAAARSLERAIAAGAVSCRRVIPYRETPKAPEGTAWDGAAEVSRADTDDLRAMCAWCDTSGDTEDGWPTAKGAYKLPHHRSDGSHPVVWRGVAAAMNALLRPPGTPRSVDIPAGDRRGVYEHLSRHYEQFDREAPSYERALRYTELSVRGSLGAEEDAELYGLAEELGFTDRWGDEEAAERDVASVIAATTSVTVSPGSLVVVGERGGEFFVPATSTTSAPPAGRSIISHGTEDRVASPTEGEGTDTNAPPNDAGVGHTDAARETVDDPRSRQLETLKIDVRRRRLTLATRIRRGDDGREDQGGA